MWARHCGGWKWKNTQASIEYFALNGGANVTAARASFEPITRESVGNHHRNYFGRQGL